MNKYIKPVAEIKEFEVTNKIASLDTWLNDNAAAKTGVAITSSAITSYYMNS